MKLNLLTILFIWSLVSCNNKEKTERAITYFDIKSFFENEAERLNTLNPVVNKIAINNDKKESRKISDINWEKELNIFTGSDINKPAWKNSYLIDTINTGKEEILVYKAKEVSLPVRYLSVSRDVQSKQIKEIEIRNVTINNLYTSTQVLKYIPGISYSVIGTQKVKLLNKTQYGIIGLLVH